MNINAILMAYVRLWNENKLMEEMVFTNKIITDTKMCTLYEMVRSYLREKEIPFEKVI
ncbi:hypothetical protein A3Q56_07356 [Intoshia linei]|uniref:Uncharacterized protein n=1 Tax=Intoshia linei TaxID=1819745 RepID=A0A177AUK7_9BILA|nr:hypothetical protein A3Q56_07356 [Intoshia linei]